jgi:long-chain fatty acid transport protein
MVALAWATSSAASEPQLFGLGARSSAMAGTGVADAEGYDATYANPAGLVEPTRRRLTLGYVHAGYALSLDHAPHPIDATNGILLGANLPIPFGGVLRNRIALGVAFYFPFNLINRARAPYPGQPRLAILDNDTQVISILVGAGARVHRRVTIGVGVLALAALVGTIAIRTDGAGRITTASEEQLVSSFAPIVGIRVRAASWVRVGAVLRGESKSSYDLEVTNRLGSVLPIPLPTLHIAGTAQYDPLQVGVETALLPLPWLTVDVGVTWKHWSAFPLPTQNATLGAPPQPTPKLHDTAVPRLGLEAAKTHRQFRFLARAGYYFEWSGSFDPALLDPSRHVLTGGGGIEWTNRLTALQLDGFAQWHHAQPSTRVSGDIGVVGVTLGVNL